MIKQNPTKSVIRFFDIREKPNNNGEMPLHMQQQQQPPPLPSFRSRKLVRNTRKISSSIASIPVILSLIVFFSILAYYFLSTDTDLNTIHRHHEKELKPDTDFLENVTRMESDQVSSFGGGGGGDSRYWDRDDRSRAKKTDPPPPIHRHHHHVGRDELKIYEKEFAASLKTNGVHNKEEFLEVENNKQMDGFEDESDDAIDSQDHEDRIHENEKGIDNAPAVTNEYDVNGVRSANGSAYEMGSDLRPPLKHHKFAGSSCEIEFLNTTAQLVEPVENEKFSRFSLQYTDVEERPSEQEQWEPRFAGHQSLKEREESFYAHDQKINCGFIKGPKGYSSTGFDLEEDDKRYMRSCHIAVSSCIFGNSDKLKSPFGKTVTRLSRKNVCFVMFIDESTLQALFSEGQVPDKLGFIGFWKIVVVKNLPFADMRRVGKIPKLLAHRLFPSARYSIWLDSKLRLQSDPLLILEFFLWRKGYEYAISNHYRRHCVWEEVAQNKRLNKFNHTIIDKQFLFYKADGLKRFNSSNPDKLLPSNVPEGSFIMRAHTSMSNLFSCLWYNEIDRFTPRDQLSFAYVYQKLRRTNPEKLFHLNMFKDCERRAIAKLFHHKSEEERNIPFESVG